MLRVATAANERVMLEHARLMTAAQLEKLTRKYALVQQHGQDARPEDDEARRYVRRRDTESGMVKIEAVLHPEEAELVWAMLDHAAKRLARDSQEAPASHDSAESHDTAALHGTTAVETSSEIHDSAESRTSSRQEATQAGTPNASDGSGGSMADTAPGSPRSLLDRLREEADARCEARELPEIARDEGPESSGPVASAVALDPRRGVGLLHRKAEAARRAFDRAEALLAIAQAYLRGDQPNRAPIDVMITIPASELCKGATDPIEVARMAASFVAAGAARRLSCDAGVIEVIEDDHGVPLSVGRKRRTIAGALKRALLRRDTECRFPGCTNHTFLKRHHIQHWADGGETALANSLLLCSRHHRFVHEHGYTIELGADSRPQFRDPRGRLVPVVPASHASIDADTGWAQIRAANTPLGIDAETIACGWDGSPADYGMMLDHLVTMDGLA